MSGRNLLELSSMKRIVSVNGAMISDRITRYILSFVEYLSWQELGNIRSIVPGIPVMALTATANNKVISKISCWGFSSHLASGYHQCTQDERLCSSLDEFQSTEFRVRYLSSSRISLSFKLRGPTQNKECRWRYQCLHLNTLSWQIRYYLLYIKNAMRGCRDQATGILRNKAWSCLIE